MRLRTLHESGGIGFAVFIGMFLAYVVITIVYLEVLRVAPVAEEVQELTEAPFIPQPYVPETPLELGQVIDLTRPQDSVVLLTVDDIEKLPEDTPQKFVNYLGNTLPGTSEEDRLGCVTAYTITQISNFNMSGAIGAADPDTGRSTDTCSKGLSVVWFIDETNWTWETENFGVLPTCAELAALPVYSEFVPECQDLNGETIDNPNGGLADRPV